MQKHKKIKGFIIDIKAVFIKQQPINAIFRDQVPSFFKLKFYTEIETDGLR